MTELELMMPYFRGKAQRVARRVTEDDRGSATAEQIMMIGFAVAGAAIVGAIIWQKMQAGANNIQTPAP
jgi:hypothetical protein